MTEDDSLATDIGAPWGYDQTPFAFIGAGNASSDQYRAARQQEKERLSAHIAATRAHYDVLIITLIDRTGSMQEYIDSARTCAKTIARTFRDDYLGSKLMFGAVMYGDTLCNTESQRVCHESLKPTDDFDNFKQFLNEVRAIGGGDNPEDIATAQILLKDMLDNELVRRRQMVPPCVTSDGKVDVQLLVYHILDAPAHGYDEGDHNTPAQRTRYDTTLDAFLETAKEFTDFEYHQFNVLPSTCTMNFCKLARDAMVRLGFAASRYHIHNFANYAPDGTKMTFGTLFQASTMSSINNSMSRRSDSLHASALIKIPSQFSLLAPYGLTDAIAGYHLLRHFEHDEHPFLVLMYHVVRRSFHSKLLAEGSPMQAVAAVCSYAERTSDYLRFLTAKKAMNDLVATREDENALLFSALPFGQGSERLVFAAKIWEEPESSIAEHFDTLRHGDRFPASSKMGWPPRDYVVKVGTQEKRVDMNRKQECVISAQVFAHLFNKNVAKALGLSEIHFNSMDHINLGPQSKVFGFSRTSTKKVPLSLKACRDEEIVLALERIILPDSSNDDVGMPRSFEKYVRNDGRRSEPLKLLLMNDGDSADAARIKAYNAYYCAIDYFILFVWMNSSKQSSWMGQRIGHYMPGDLQGRFRYSEGVCGAFHMTDVSALSTNGFAFDNGVDNLGPAGYIDKIASQAWYCLNAKQPESLNKFLDLVRKDASFFSSLTSVSKGVEAPDSSWRFLSFTCGDDDSTASSSRPDANNSFEDKLKMALSAGVLNRQEYEMKLKQHAAAADTSHADASDDQGTPPPSSSKRLSKRPIVDFTQVRRTRHSMM